MRSSSDVTRQGLVPYFADLDALTHYLMGLTKPHEPIQTSFA